MTDTTLTREQEIRAIHKEFGPFYQLGGGVLLVLIGIAIGVLIFADDTGYGTNLYTEAISVGLTILVLNTLQERREERRRIRDLQEQLVREAGSSIHTTAVTAVDTIRKRGWLYGADNHGDTEALLSGADLSRADLHQANLSSANLADANLHESNLSRANLWQVDLRGTDLRGANLSGALLEGADLSAADLGDANLSGADLRFANLSSARLERANLTGANLRTVRLDDALIQKSTQFNDNTILPDWLPWSAGRDLAEFGAETRQSVFRDPLLPIGEEDTITFTFADGTKRRWQRGKGWLDERDAEKVSLAGIYLRNAALTDADFRKVDLSSADLDSADLSGANLEGANLSNANLSKTKLVGTIIRDTNLNTANLEKANLSHANLSRADLHGADLRSANLSGAMLNAANLNGAIIQASTQFDDNTTLPDGSKWSIGRDLAEFGVEDREIVESQPSFDVWGNWIATYTFADGTKRRWEIGKGWLDDREGKPLS